MSEGSGLLRELVKTRYGFHIVAVDRRVPGAKLPFDVVRDDIAERLHAMVEENMQLHAALFMERWIR